MNKKAAVLLSIATVSVCVPAGAAERLDVEIVDRRENESLYSYVVPGTATSSTSGDVNCTSYGNNANCGVTSNTTTYSTPSRAGQYQVRGATFSLRLPDGRIAVVNCERKTNWTEFSPNWYRSCRMPLVNKIHAEFSGDKAKLRWPVSIDGKKFESETYKILAVLDAPAVTGP